MSTYALSGLLVKPNYIFLLMEQEETHGDLFLFIHCLLISDKRGDRGGLEEQDPVCTGPRAGGTKVIQGNIVEQQGGQ